MMEMGWPLVAELLLLGTVTESDGTVSKGDGLGDLSRIVNGITDLGFTWTDPQSLK